MLTVAAGMTSPFCGTAPLPAEVMQRWHLAPLPLIAAGAVMVLYLAMARRQPAYRHGCFAAGWAAALIAFVSPLCALSVALCSARIAEHMILTTVSAPLIALGWPPRSNRPVLAAALFWAVLWLWHAPLAYDATFRSGAAFWMMQVTLFGSALWLWRALFAGRLAPVVVATFMTTGQMGLLGAIITFAGHALYAPHFATTLAWGLTPLEDQQLGGVVMWVPAGVIFAAAFVLGFAAVLRQAEARTPLGAR